MHGAHQVAHTSTTTTLPRRSLKESVEPSGRTPLKLMAVCPGFDHANRSSIGFKAFCKAVDKGSSPKDWRNAVYFS